ncbi:MAG: hypothetical protein HY046_04900 [Acidobacteria bacterium]|nr:hypothetical protein [Acidobacteriota bacterium]
MKIYTQKTWIASTLVFVMTITPLTGQSQNAKSATQNKWTAGFRDDKSPAGPFAKISLRVEDGRIVCSAKKDTTCTIPASSIVEVQSTNQAEHGAFNAGLRTAGKPAMFMLQTHDTSGAAAGLLAVYMFYGFVPATVISAIVHSREKYRVTLAWNDEDVPHLTEFQLRPRECSEFLSALNQATEKKWLNLVEEKKALREAARTSTGIHVQRYTYIGDIGLKPGPYQLVLVPQQEGMGNLFFLAGTKPNLRRIAAVARVEITATMETKPTEFLRYEQRFGVETLAEIQLPNKSLRILKNKISEGGAAKTPGT